MSKFGLLETPLLQAVPVALGAKAYTRKLLNIDLANLLAYWPLSEASGTDADNKEGTAARDGTFSSDVSGWGTGDGIGDGKTAPDFDGTNDWVDIYSASLSSAFDGDEGTAFIWAKVSGVGVWTDGAYRRLFHLRADNNNLVTAYKHLANNRIDFFYEAGGTVETLAKSGLSETGWMSFALTWSAAADEFKVYYNGSQEGTTQTGLGVWAGTLTNTTTTIGSQNTTPSQAWDGYLAHCAVWKTPLSATQIAKLATV
jgi:hypothetical protein